MEGAYNELLHMHRWEDRLTDGGNGENPLEQIAYHSHPAERLETSTAWFGWKHANDRRVAK